MLAITSKHLSNDQNITKFYYEQARDLTAMRSQQLLLSTEPGGPEHAANHASLGFIAT